MALQRRYRDRRRAGLGPGPKAHSLQPVSFKSSSDSRAGLLQADPVVMLLCILHWLEVLPEAILTSYQLNLCCREGEPSPDCELVACMQ